MKHLKRTLLGAVAVAALAMPAFAKDHLRFASFEPPVGFVTSKVLSPWAEEVSAASNDSLQIDIFAGGTLGRDPTTQLQLVLDGVADIAFIAPAYTPGRFDQTSLVEIPFLVPSSEVGSVAAARMIDQGLWSGGGFDDVKVLGVFVTSPVHYASTKPVNALEDVKGQNVRTSGAIKLKVIEALGGVPVGGIAAPKIAESMSRGVLDATPTEFTGLQIFRVLDLDTHHFEVPLGSSALMVVMNKDKYASLSDDAKAAIDGLDGEAFSQRFGSLFDANEASIRADSVAAENNTVVTPDAAEIQRWKDAAAPAGQSWIDEADDRQGLYDAFAAEVENVVAGN